MACEFCFHLGDSSSVVLGSVSISCFPESGPTNLASCFQYLEAEGVEEEGEAPSSITDVYFARINRTAVKATEMRDAGKRILDSLSLSLSLRFHSFISSSGLSSPAIKRSNLLRAFFFACSKRLVKPIQMLILY